MFINALSNIFVKIGEMFTYIGTYVIRILQVCENNCLDHAYVGIYIRV